jgi:hypothetical protein
MPIWLDTADSNVVKMLKTVLFSSRDGVPLKKKKNPGGNTTFQYLQIEPSFDPS